jgi:hypothetical protein
LTGLCCSTIGLPIGDTVLPYAGCAVSKPPNIDVLPDNGVPGNDGPGGTEIMGCDSGETANVCDLVDVPMEIQLCRVWGRSHPAVFPKVVEGDPFSTFPERLKSRLGDGILWDKADASLGGLGS